MGAAHARYGSKADIGVECAPDGGQVQAGGFDRLLGVVVLILHRAHVAERGVESARVVDLIDEAWKVSCNVI